MSSSASTSGQQRDGMEGETTAQPRNEAIRRAWASDRHSSSRSWPLSGADEENSEVAFSGDTDSAAPSESTASLSSSSAAAVIALDPISQPLNDQLHFYETPTHVYLLASNRLRTVYHALTFVKHTLADVQAHAEAATVTQHGASAAETTRMKARPTHPVAGSLGEDYDAAHEGFLGEDTDSSQPWPWCARLAPQAAVLTATEAQSFVDSLRHAHASPDVRLPLRWGRAKALVGAVRFTAGYYLLLVTARRLVARIGSHRIFEAAETELISLLQQPPSSTSSGSATATSSSASSSPSETAAATATGSDGRQRLSGARYLASLASAAIPSLFRRSTEEETYAKQFTDIGFHRHAFYYSHTYDLTNTLQTNMTVPSVRRERRLKFSWNEFLHEPFAELWSETEDEDGDEGEGGNERENSANNSGHDNGEDVDANGRRTREPDAEHALPPPPRAELDPLNADPFEEEDMHDEHDEYDDRDAHRRHLRRPRYAGEDELPMSNYFHASTWRIAFIHGAVIQKVLWLQHRSVLLTLIGRVSREHTGARYLRRGVNSDGHVANHVEVEQIVCDESSLGRHHTRGAFSAYVQVRGSIPLHWSHAPSSLPKPPILLALHVDPTYHDTRLHFQELITDYGVPVVCMDFVKLQEKRPREVPLGTAYRSAVERLAALAVVDGSQGGSDGDVDRHTAAKAVWPRARRDIVQYHAIDLRRAADRAWNAVTAAAESTAARVGFFACLPPHAAPLDGVGVDPARADAMHTADQHGARLVRLQHGVVRSNCIDCIDRTNIGQYFLSLHALGHQLASLGLVCAAPDLALSPSVQELLLQMYLFMGDAIAIQYGGSAQVGAGVLHRGTGWDQWMGIQRLYHNVLGDREKQMVVNLFLGRFQPAPLFWWKLFGRARAYRSRQGRGGARPLFVSPLQQQQQQEEREKEDVTGPRTSAEHLAAKATKSQRKHGAATASRVLFPRFVSRALNPNMSLIPSVLMRGAVAAAGVDGRSCPPVLLPFVFPRASQASGDGYVGLAARTRSTSTRASARQTAARTGESLAKLLENAYADPGSDYYLLVREAPRLRRSPRVGPDEHAWWQGPLLWHLTYRRCAAGGAHPHTCGMTSCESCRFLDRDLEDEEGETENHERQGEVSPTERLRQHQHVHGRSGSWNTSDVLNDVSAEVVPSLPSALPSRQPLPLPKDTYDAVRRSEVQRIEMAAQERQLCIEPPLDDLGEEVTTGGGNKATLQEAIAEGFQLELGTAVITAHTVSDSETTRHKTMKKPASASVRGLDVVELAGTTRATSPSASYGVRRDAYRGGQHDVPTAATAAFSLTSRSLSQPPSCWWDDAARTPPGLCMADERTVSARACVRYCPRVATLLREVKESVYARELADRALWRPSFGVSLGHDVAGDAITFAGDQNGGGLLLTNLDGRTESEGADEEAEMQDTHSTVVLVAQALAAQYGAAPTLWSTEHVRGALRACLETAGATPLTAAQWAAFRANAHDGAWLSRLAERYEERCDRGYWAMFFSRTTKLPQQQPNKWSSSSRYRRSRSPSRSPAWGDGGAYREVSGAARRLSAAFVKRWFACMSHDISTTSTSPSSACAEAFSWPEEQHDGLQLLLRVTQYLVHVANGAVNGSLSSKVYREASRDKSLGTVTSSTPSLEVLAETLTRLLHLGPHVVHADNVESVIDSMLVRMTSADDAVPEHPRLRFSDAPVSSTSPHARVQASFILPPSVLRSELVLWWAQPRVLTSRATSQACARAGRMSYSHSDVATIRVHLSAEEAALLVSWLLDTRHVLPLFALPRDQAVAAAATTSTTAATATNSSFPRGTRGFGVRESDEDKLYNEDPTALFCLLASLEPCVLNADSSSSRDEAHTMSVNTSTNKRTASAPTNATGPTPSVYIQAAALAESLASVAVGIAQSLPQILAEPACGAAEDDSASATGHAHRGSRLVATLATLEGRLAELAAGLLHIDLARAIQDLEQSFISSECSVDDVKSRDDDSKTTSASRPAASHTGVSTGRPPRFSTLPSSLARRDRFLLCFFVNVYNALYVHAWLHALRQQLTSAGGVASFTSHAHHRSSLTVAPASCRSSVAFYEKHAYRIGPDSGSGRTSTRLSCGNVFSLSDIKYGILQGNSPRPYSGLAPFVTCRQCGAVCDARARYIPWCLRGRDAQSGASHSRGGGGAENSADSLLDTDVSSLTMTDSWRAVLIAHAHQHASEMDSTARTSASRTAQCAAHIRAGWRLQEDDARYLCQRVVLSLCDAYLAAPFLDNTAFPAHAPSLFTRAASPTQPRPGRAESTVSPSSSMASPTADVNGPCFPTNAATASFASVALDDSWATQPAMTVTTTATTSTANIDIWSVISHSTATVAFTLVPRVSEEVTSWATVWRALPPIFLESTFEAQLRQVEQTVVQRLASVRTGRPPHTVHNNNNSNSSPVGTRSSDRSSHSSVVTTYTRPLTMPSPHSVPGPTATTAAATMAEGRRLRFLVRLAAGQPHVFVLRGHGNVSASQDVTSCIQAGHDSSHALAFWEDAMRQLHDHFR